MTQSSATAFAGGELACALMNLKTVVRLPGEATVSLGVNNLGERNFAVTKGYFEAGAPSTRTSSSSFDLGGRFSFSSPAVFESTPPTPARCAE